MAKVAHQHPPQPSKVNADLPTAADYVIERAMAKAPTNRYPHGQALAEDIADLLAGREPRHRGGWSPPERGEGTLVSSRASVEAESLDLPLQPLDEPRPETTAPRRARSQPFAILAVGMLAVGAIAVSLSAVWPDRVAETLRVTPSPLDTPSASAPPAPAPVATAVLSPSPAATALPATPATVPTPAPEGALDPRSLAP